MDVETPEPVAAIAGHPILRILVSFPIACFASALATDILYAATANMMWADFSTWLLAAGMAFAVLAAIAGIIDIIASRRVRPQRPFGLIIGSALVMILGFLDNLIHTRDAWTSVVPFGLALSLATVIVMLVTAWLGSATLYRPAMTIQYAGVRQ